jgi:hypothetical protein
MSLDINEKSFFSLINFNKYETIYHNLEDWHLKFDGWVNKAGQIETNIIVPYSEMTIKVCENNSDINFFNKHTVRIKLIIKKNGPNYIFNDKRKCAFNENAEYVLLDTPYIYPHNWYYLSNRSYLLDKVMMSMEYIDAWLNGYKSIFNSNVPFIFISRIYETAQEYKIDIIIKDYLDIAYVATDVENSLVYMNILVNNSYQKGQPTKYKKTTIYIPRLLKNKKNNFKFVACGWNKLV